MPHKEIEIAALSNLPIAEKGNAQRRFSTAFWESVFKELSKFPVLILAGNLFVSCPDDTEEIVQRRLDLLLHLLKHVHSIPIAILGQREGEHGHADLIKKQLRRAGVNVLTGSPKHHVVSVRFRTHARFPGQTIRFLGLSGERAGVRVSVSDVGTAQSPEIPQIAVDEGLLQTYLSELESTETVTPVIPILPMVIDRTLSEMLDQHTTMLHSVIVGAGDRLHTPRSTTGGVPIYSVSVPTMEQLQFRDEIKPIDLITRIPLHPRD